MRVMRRGVCTSQEFITRTGDRDPPHHQTLSLQLSNIFQPSLSNIHDILILSTKILSNLQIFTTHMCFVILKVRPIQE